jgi:transposase
MRGREDKQARMVLTTLSPDSKIPKNHPLRRIKGIAELALAGLEPMFEEMYSQTGRPSIPPERLLKGTLLIHLYSVRSERQFCEQLDYNLLFRWFLDMDIEEATFDATTFTKNRDRLMAHDAGKRFFDEVVYAAQLATLLSSDHFTLDGTLIDACASLKSLRRKDETPEGRTPPDDPGNPMVDFHGEKRTNETHVSATDPEAKLMRKGAGREARLSFAQHVLMENRHGLVVDVRLTPAVGVTEREIGLEMLKGVATKRRRITVAGDKGYDTRGFVAGCRELNVTPHVAQALRRSGGSAIDGRTTRHEGYRLSQRIRKRVEEIFGWQKTVGGFRRTRYRGVAKNQFASYLIAAAYNLVRISRLVGATA